MKKWHEMSKTDRQGLVAAAICGPLLLLLWWGHANAKAVEAREVRAAQEAVVRDARFEVDYTPGGFIELRNAGGFELTQVRIDLFPDNPELRGAHVVEKLSGGKGKIIGFGDFNEKLKGYSGEMPPVRIRFSHGVASGDQLCEVRQLAPYEPLTVDLAVGVMRGILGVAVRNDHGADLREVEVTINPGARGGGYDARIASLVRGETVRIEWRQFVNSKYERFDAVRLDPQGIGVTARIGERQRGFYGGRF